MLRAHLLHLDELDARQEGQAIARAGRHSGQNFKVFCAAFNRLQDQCRNAAFVDTVGKMQGASLAAEHGFWFRVKGGASTFKASEIYKNTVT